jgi:hypothetical protein
MIPAYEAALKHVPDNPGILNNPIPLRRLDFAD